MRVTSPTTVAMTVVASFGLATVTASGLDLWLDVHPVSTKATTSTSDAVKPTAPVTNLLLSNPSAFSRCPVSCSDIGNNPSDWTVYHALGRLIRCDETMLLDFNIYNALDNPTTHISIRSCTADSAIDVNLPAEKNETSLPGNTNVQMKQVEASLQLGWLDSDTIGSTTEVVAAAQQIQSYLVQQNSHNGSIAFAYSGQSVVGVYAGSQIQRQDITTSILEQFISEVQNKGINGSLIAQLCEEGRSSRYTLGIIANADSDLPFVQEAVKTWKEGQCITSLTGSTTWQSATLSIPILPTSTNSSSTNTIKTTRALHPRTTCSTIEVYSGDSCASLAAECGITAAEFTDYNPSSTLCSTLAQGQHVCCSSGTLPDFAPSAYSNGTCYTYLVQSGDSCSSIAATWSLTVDELESYNNDTWGWMGCDDLQASENICLSTGSAPMPAPLANAVCGPQVPGTAVPPSGTNMSTLNECPLNACCDIWGQCGTTSEFCTISESSTGAPGTAAAGSNGCISNCGTDIVTSSAPSEFRRVGYFEAFNLDRPCLNEYVLDIDYSAYTHVHLGFGTLTPDFDINVTAISDQFDMFLKVPDVKHILSIGGWAFSTDPSTYDIFRQAVLPENVGTFVSNVVAFVQKYGLDGIDFDWEYPGEPDIKGIPAGNTTDGFYYFLFLDELQNSLQEAVPGATISIAAPASYWYLQGFPIDAIGLVVDYIIFMTYDLHGQWDYANAFSDPGCPAGSCLRSDVNLTETVNALSMITKAGVASNQVVVGVTSYGRSFQMTTAGCYTEMCTFTGPSSGAYEGICTGTAGYLANAEISYLNATMSNTYTYVDDSFSNVLIYDDTQWVAYMDDDNKAVRTALYESLNFGGTTDWAIDLQGSASSLIAACGNPSSSTGAPAACVSSTNTTTCIAGTGSDGYEDLCEFTCEYGFCPIPCTCTSTGSPVPLPVTDGDVLNACVASGLDYAYTSLCQFACEYGYCPTSTCSTDCPTELDVVTSSVTFLPESSLTNQSSCQDLANVGNLETASMWNQMDTTAELQNWLNNPPIPSQYSKGDGNFTAGFGTPIGIGTSFGEDCSSISSTCQPYDCSKLTNPDTSGIAWKYLVVESIVNLNRALTAVITAVNQDAANYTSLANTLVENYYPSSSSGYFDLIEILTAIGTAVAAVFTLTGSAVAGAGGVLFAGGITELTNYLGTLSSTDTIDVNKLTAEVWDWAGHLEDTLQSDWTSMIDDASSDMMDLFENGAWVDYRTNPILNNSVSQGDVNSWYMNILAAGTINYLWTQSDIYLYCMEMSEDDWANPGKANGQTIGVPAGLQTYSQGYGCFFQGISPDTTNGNAVYYNPTGYEDIVNGLYNFTTSDMVASSLTTWLKHGFNYTAPVNEAITNVLSMTTDEFTSGSYWTADATFNLPICMYPSSDAAGVDAFFAYVNSDTNDGVGAYASWCLCANDLNGKTFGSIMPITTQVDCICDSSGCGTLGVSPA